MFSNRDLLAIFTRAMLPELVVSALLIFAVLSLVLWGYQ